jgi:hypothetical protein
LKTISNIDAVIDLDSHEIVRNIVENKIKREILTSALQFLRLCLVIGGPFYWWRKPKTTHLPLISFKNNFVSPDIC